MLLLRLIRWALLMAVGAVAGFAAAAASVKGLISSRGDAESDELALVSIFDSVDFTSRSAAFRGGSILAWFGGVQLDLSQATLAHGARLEINAMFGGVSITIPPTWSVEVESTAFAGGVSVPPDVEVDAEAPTLVVSARSLFGGIAIHS